MNSVIKGVPSDQNPWGLKLKKPVPGSDQPQPNVIVDLDKRGEEISFMQVSQFKINGNVARVRIEVSKVKVIHT